MRVFITIICLTLFLGLQAQNNTGTGTNGVRQPSTLSGGPHFDYVSSEVSKGVATASMQTRVPCIFGVLTTDTIEQAVERAGTKAGNKGFEAGLSAIEMVSLFRKLKD